MRAIAAPAKVAALTGMHWWTRRLPDREFIIGDSPLLTRPEHPRRNGFNLRDPNLLIVLPIGPKVVFFASPNLRNRTKVCRERPSVLEKQLNAMTVLRSRDYVFCRREAELSNIDGLFEAREARAAFAGAA